MMILDITEPGAASQETTPHYAVGIDLGTTNSVAAVVKDDACIFIPDDKGNAILPSVVAKDTAGNSIVGQAAIGHPSAIHSVKRLMGKQENSGFAVEASAAILRALKQRAEAFLQHEVTEAVITVPAYFDDAARVATKDAAQLAGLNVLRLVNEPTAAALAYGLDNASEGIYAVYDFGGGTFDVSILLMQKGVFQVLATGGDTHLGGDDIDHVIVEYLVTEQEFSDSLSAEQRQALHLAARRLKEQLTDHDSAETTLELNGLRVLKLTRVQLENLAQPFIRKTCDIFSNVLKDSGLSISDITGVVMVGGSTRMPLVQASIAALTGKTPLTNLDPDLVVAMGAAQQAHILSRGGDALLLDVTPLTLGLETMGGLVESIIPRNTPIPCSKSQKFTTYQDGQTGMVIHALQGERELVHLCRSLAKFDLKGIPALPAGAAVVEVNFTLDADGILTVSAQEEHTGIRQQVAVKPSYGLPPEAMEQMLRDSMQHAREDITARLLIESRFSAERALKEISQALERDGDLLSETDRRLIDTKMDEIRELVQGQDRDAIDYEVEQLNHICTEFAEKRMNRALQQFIAGHQLDDVAKTLAN